MSFADQKFGRAALALAERISQAGRLGPVDVNTARANKDWTALEGELIFQWSSAGRASIEEKTERIYKTIEDLHALIGKEFTQGGHHPTRNTTCLGSATPRLDSTIITTLSVLRLLKDLSGGRFMRLRFSDHGVEVVRHMHKQYVEGMTPETPAAGPNGIAARAATL